MFYSTLYAFAVSALVLQVCLFNLLYDDNIFLEYIIWSKKYPASQIFIIEEPGLTTVGRPRHHINLAIQQSGRR